MFEKRNGFLWIIQGAMFLGLSNFIGKADLIASIIPFVGLFVSFSWILVAKRDRESIFLTEMELRDVECELNKIYNNIVKLNKFSLDKKVIMGKEEVIFGCSQEVFNEDQLKEFWKIDNFLINKIDNIMFRIIKRYPKLSSTSISIGSIFPKFFLIVWVILLISTMVKVFCR